MFFILAVFNHYLSLPALHISLFYYKMIVSKVFVMKSYFPVEEVSLDITSNIEQNNFLSNSPFFSYDRDG